MNVYTNYKHGGRKDSKLISFIDELSYYFRALFIETRRKLI